MSLSPLELIVLVIYFAPFMPYLTGFTATIGNQLIGQAYTGWNIGKPRLKPLTKCTGSKCTGSQNARGQV
jgi:hypothetical protein